MGGAEYRRLATGLIVHRTGPEHAEQLEELQRIVFPTLTPAERFEARHYLRHIELFPEGQFCVVDPGTGSDARPLQLPPTATRVVGMTSTIRMDIEFSHPAHTFAEIIQGGWLTSHQPAGSWLYGADVGTHPAYRQRGIARALYAARQDTVHQLCLGGQLTVGMPSGYGAVKDELTAEAYYAELLAGTRHDPTISVQLRIGFEMRGLLPGYINDPVCAGYGILLVLPAEREVRFP